MFLLCKCIGFQNIWFVLMYIFQEYYSKYFIGFWLQHLVDGEWINECWGETFGLVYVMCEEEVV